MPKAHAPRRGSMQFWPRKRAKCSLARVHSWPKLNQAKPLAFIGYKAGMTHLFAINNRQKSLTKDQEINLAATILDCPPMVVAGLVFYKNSKKLTQILNKNLDKQLSKKIPLPKKETKKIDDVSEFDDVRLLVHTQPKKTTIGTKKPKLVEIGLGGSKEDKFEYAKQKLGQEIKINEVFDAGSLIDAHGITVGKGFQGTVKRFGVMIRSHKAEKTKRGIGNLGAWTPKRVMFNVPQPGKMGYHLRTEYNKQILKISDKPEEINPKAGLERYGLVKNSYVLLKGSVPGPKRRALMMVTAIRPNKKATKEAPEIKYIAK